MSSTRLADLPAATAPPGYTQDLINPPETKHINAGITISIVGMVVSTLFIILRVYTKAHLARNFGVDDVAMLFAWMLSIGLQIMVVWLWAVEYIGVHMWNLTTGHVNLAVLLISLSVERWFKYAVYAVMAFIISYSIALGLALVFACTPLDKNWDITITVGSCVNKGQLYLATAGLNAATDVILLVLPIPMIIKLHVPIIQKVGLILMFGIGSLTLVTSLVRLSLLPPMVTATDTTWAISTPAIWICIEANLVIICGCLPILRLFFRHVAPRFIGESSETVASHPSTSLGKKPIHSVAELSNLDNKERRQAAQHPYDRMNEWDDWERDMGEDDGSDTYTMDSSGRIVACKTAEAQLEAQVPHPPRKKRLSGSQQNRLSVPTWFSADSSGSASPAPAPTFVIGRNDDGRYSLRPHAM
ncbi:hypothetical protein M409DRAFT_21622 [Zasmidium cellare ATCC 36951]|uniref:Rhodopsin domain-containing protein n=1 Tax=Zasmidium cellare ATCC 36951 TaxID=1080233 RepID=A0A6A6CPM1_ZASCE|nr:uncharacterized protein M409DRAFT_21622 [Zasmidium cellare ATCC 36951]KAF2168178.1 hypothetical protein M409DRAFT_21622 [Zasmidium cellare ATCC 36951]